jgi:hypothetical protein
MSLKLPPVTYSKQASFCPIINKCIGSNNAYLKHNFLKNEFFLDQILCFRSPKKLFYKKYFLLLFALVFVMISSAQMTAPYAVNIAGNQVTKGNYNVEWSIGESAAINIMDNSDGYVFTNGLLQFSVQNQTENNLVASFLTNEIRMYPNPIKNELYINILHASKGIDLIELLDGKGNKLKEKILVYNGMGALEIWNLAGLNAGQYFVNIRHTHTVTGKLIKKGAFKILKTN